MSSQGGWQGRQSAVRAPAPARVAGGDASPPADPDSDAALVAATALGSLPAFERLYRRHYRNLYRFVMRVTGRPEVTEEAINDTFFVLWTKADTFNGASRVSTWLYGIAYRKAMKALSQAKPRGEQVDIDEQPDQANDAPLPSDHVETRETARELTEAIAQLPPGQRAVVELTFFHGMSYAEIGDLLGCPVNTVKTRMFHARSKLKAFLRATGFEYPSVGG